MRNLTPIDGGLCSLNVTGFATMVEKTPATRLDVAQERRERAALLVLAIGRGYTPEDLADGVPSDVLGAFGDELEREEALAHVDLLLGALAPRMEAVG